MRNLHEPKVFYKEQLFTEVAQQISLKVFSSIMIHLKTWKNLFSFRAKKIDVLSRIIFPAIFACFNLSYWCYYLMQEAHSGDQI